MTISTTTLLNSFSGNGSVVDFTYTYPINSASELLVIIKTDATGVETTKTLTSDYTVALAGDSGGTVTMGTAPASGETLFLIRNTTKTQGTDLIENDPFSAEGLEDSFDNLQMQIQEVSNAVDRSFKVSKTNSITTSEITTSAADRANKILSFDASGNVEATAFTNLDTLNEMTDVTITSPADNEVLAYDSSSTHFINQTAAEAGLVATGAVTGITSLLATDIKIGEDNETKIDFETADEIHFYAANAEQAYVADGVFGPQTDSDVDLGTTSVRWANAYIDSITTTGNITSAGTVSFGNDGTITATAFVDEDDMSSDSATLIPTQQSVKAYVDAKKADMQFVLEDGDGTEVQIVKDSEVKFVEGGGIDINWTDTSTGSDADPFDLTFAIDSTVATLTGSQTLTNKTLTSPVLNTGVSGTAVKDEDNMASDSASHLATQQSIKAYVDAVTTSLNAQDLDVSDGSSAIGIDLDTETLGILGGTGLTSSASGNNVTLSVDAAQTQITSVGALDAGSITSLALATLIMDHLQLQRLVLLLVELLKLLLIHLLETMQLLVILLLKV
jgi:predicted DNA-binding WGR domain protein